MAVRIRMKKMGRAHRPFYRIVAMDARQQRDGRVIEQLGSYDPMIRNVDERVRLKASRVKYWMSVGAKPTEKVEVLLRKYLSKWEEAEAAAAAGTPVEAAAPASSAKAPSPAPQPTPQGTSSAEEAPAEAETEPTARAETPTGQDEQPAQE